MMISIQNTAIISAHIKVRRQQHARNPLIHDRSCKSGSLLADIALVENERGRSDGLHEDDDD
jgi:hypothetical protein